MQTVISLNNKNSQLPIEFQHDDNRYPESLVKYFLDKYTKKGDKVLDIFAGLGTTMIVAEKLGRIPYGIEIDKKRCDYINSKIKRKEHLICGSSLNLNHYVLPKFDFAITSPPYNRLDEENYLSKKGGYNGFLIDIKKIYQKLKPLMKPNAHLVIEVANLKGKEVTTLAWDIGKVVSQIFHFEGEIIVEWKTKGQCMGVGNYGYGYDHSYCLVFKNK